MIGAVVGCSPSAGRDCQARVRRPAARNTRCASPPSAPIINTAAIGAGVSCCPEAGPRRRDARTNSWASYLLLMRAGIQLSICNINSTRCSGHSRPTRRAILSVFPMASVRQRARRARHVAGHGRTTYSCWRRRTLRSRKAGRVRTPSAAGGTARRGAWPQRRALGTAPRPSGDSARRTAERKPQMTTSPVAHERSPSTYLRSRRRRCTRPDGPGIRRAGSSGPG
jgi:hypothetical protein